MFEQLTERLQAVVRTLRGSVKIDDKVFDQVARELRLALLEADVNFGVVKSFLAEVRERSLGEDVLHSLTPGQQVISIVHEELRNLFGGSRPEFRLEGPSPVIVMIVGMQGAGKTTTIAKLGHRFHKDGRSPMLVSVDVYRPAAREQLAQIGAAAGLNVYREAGDDPLILAQDAVRFASRRGHDLVLLDTAGRLHLDDKMMGEIRVLSRALPSTRSVYVADALAGQDAVTAATSFADCIDLDGVILTKLDGDARGGAALSIAAVTGLPILFAGVGERFEDLEDFYPDRMASRILGMGDVLTLIERARDVVEKDQVVGLEKRLQRGSLTLEDFQQQLRQVRKLGPLSQLVKMLPGGGSKGLGAITPDDTEFRQIEAIINSMTPAERRRPRIIDGSRRRRIAAGSGTRVQHVNRLLKQFAQMKKLMKRFGKRGERSLPFVGLP